MKEQSEFQIIYPRKKSDPILYLHKIIYKNLCKNFLYVSNKDTKINIV